MRPPYLPTTVAGRSKMFYSQGHTRTCTECFSGSAGMYGGRGRFLTPNGSAPSDYENCSSSPLPPVLPRSLTRWQVSHRGLLWAPDPD